MDDLFKAIRDAAPRSEWSKGVALSRAQGITGDSSTESEIKLRVNDPSKGVNSSVSLYLKDEDWFCDCNSDIDPCYHVVAAAIAVKQARESGENLPQSTTSSKKVSYSLENSGNQLALWRYAEDLQGNKVKIQSRLTNRDLGVTPTKSDTAMDLAMGRFFGGPIPKDLVPKIFPLFEQLELSYMGKQVRSKGRKLGVLVTLTEEGPGIKLTAGPDPLLTMTFENGLAFVDSELVEITIPELPPREAKIVREGRFFAPTELTMLAGEILPKLKNQVRIDIQANNLPDIEWARPEVEITIARQEETLHLESTLVYGDPPIARVRDGRLVSTTGKSVNRDIDQERKLRDEFWRDVGVELGTKHTFEGPALFEMIGKLHRFRGQIRGSLDAFTVLPEPEIEWTVDERGVSIQFQTTSGSDSGLTFAALNTAWQNGEKYIGVAGSGFLTIPQEWMARYADRIQDLLAQTTAGGELPRYSVPGATTLMEDLGVAVPDQWKNLRDELAKSLEQSSPIDNRFQGTLRHYQNEGVQWLLKLKQLRFGALLADEMGLGKTVQTIAVLAPRSLIVAPTSLLANWARELQKFRPDLSVCVYHGSNRKLDADADIVITSYALVRLDLQDLTGLEWNTIVLDEAQNIKNPESQIARSVVKLQSEFKLCLSGTPLENHLSDLWSQFNFLNPGLLGTHEHFNKNTIKPLQDNHELLDLLRNKIRPFILRRSKSEVAKDLPSKTEILLDVDLSEEEKEVYTSIYQQAKVRAQQSETSVFDIFQLLLRLRQACCHTRLLPDGPKLESSKTRVLLDNLQSAIESGSQCLVFSQWKTYLEIIDEELRSAGIKTAMISGSTTDRQGIVDRFQKENSEIDVLLMTLKAGGVGLNLTGADHVFIMDPWWNPAAEAQAADRAHRIGQTKPVFIHKLVATGTIEEQIILLQSSKQHLADSLVAGTSTALSKDELLSLLSL